MGSSDSASKLGLGVAAAALAVAGLALLRTFATDPTQPPSPAPEESPAEPARTAQRRAPTPNVATTNATKSGYGATGTPSVEDLRQRLSQLEAVVGRTPSGSPRAAAANNADTVALLRDIEIRLAALEQSNGRRTGSKLGLADIDNIRSALAVLLSSRGVRIKATDVQALQSEQSQRTLGAVAQDRSYSDWERIEAYRGMMMFGFEHPKAGLDAMGGMTDVLLTSRDAKARASAAGMLSYNANASTAPALLAALQAEQDPATQAALATTMFKLKDDTGIRAALQQLQARTKSTELKRKISRALER
ncbi:MAG: hypothetical protein AB8H80_16040 [Planctomycetota bacterium]